MKRLLLALLTLPMMAGAHERVVSIGGDVTEIVWALGASPELVARDSTSLEPKEVTALPDIGYMRMLNPEGILAMRPTLVLASAQAQPSVALKQVADANIKVVTIPAENNLAVIDAKIASVADALNKQQAGDALRAKVKQQLATIPSTPIDKKVLFIMSHGGTTPMAAGQQTAADAVIQAAGLHNAMQGFNRYQPLSQEGVIGSQPDLIIVTEDGVKSLGGEANVWALPGLAQTPAAKHKQLLVVKDMAFLGFGIDTPQAVVDLRHKAEQLP